MVGRVKFGDISFSRGEVLAREALKLVENGGEGPPRLTRYPNEPRSGVLPESVPA
jgi:hypothetical protein